MKRYFALYAQTVRMHIMKFLEYELDFLLTFVSFVFIQLSGFIFLKLVFTYIPSVNGWTFSQSLVIYSFVFMAEGLNQLFIDGLWDLGYLINTGRFDYYASHPVSPIFLVLSSGVNFNGIGNVLTGAALIAYALIAASPVSIAALAVLPVFLILAACVRGGILLTAASCTFFYHSKGNALVNMVHNLSQFARYPLSIYPAFLRAVFTWAVPYAFMSFIPAAVIFGKTEHPVFWFLSVCLAAAVLALIARMVFYAGLRRYESTGN